MGWFTELLNALAGGKNGTASRGSSQAIQFVCHYLARKHNDCFVDAIKLTGTQLVEPLDPIATFVALQSVCNLPASKMKLLKCFLESELGVKVFSSPAEIKKVIGMDLVVPITGIFNYAGSTSVMDPRSKDKIPWMYKSAKEIIRLLLRMQVREKRGGFKWNHLDVSTCIDHGKGFLRATLICVLRQLDDSGERSVCEEQHCFSVSNAQCSKDNCDIVKGTFGRILNDEMKTIGNARYIRIWLPEGPVLGNGNCEHDWSNAMVTFAGEHELESENVTNTLTLFTKILVDLWMSGDLKWIAAAYGKENSSGHWCPCCLKGAKQWSPAPPTNVGEDIVNTGPYWTLELLREYAEGVASGRLKKSSERNGVFAEPAIDYVGPDKIVFPVLHATFGLANNWLKSFIKEMQAASEAYTTEYLEAEEAMGNALDAFD